MGLRMLVKGDPTKAPQQDCPVIICDHCGEEITDGLNASYVWRRGVNEPSDTLAEVFFVHNTFECHRGWERSHPEKPGEIHLSMNLDVLPHYLGNNLNIDQEGSEARARYFATGAMP